jgi:hypothetical protein
MRSSVFSYCGNSGAFIYYFLRVLFIDSLTLPPYYCREPLTLSYTNSTELQIYHNASQDPARSFQ